MSMVINTNYLSLVAQNNLNTSQSALNTAIQRLSSGLRINSAADDAAGEAISNRMTAQINGLDQASRNANDGISIAQTTEGALDSINDNLQRIRELTVQAANGSNSASDLDSIQSEIQQRLAEIDRVSAQTQFNGVNVLAQNNTLSLQVGANDGQTISIDLQQITTQTLGLNGFNVNGGGVVTNKAATAGDIIANGGSTNGGAYTYSATTQLKFVTAQQAFGQMQAGDTVKFATPAVNGGTSATYTMGADGNFTYSEVESAGSVSSLYSGQAESGTFNNTNGANVSFTTDANGDVYIGGQKAYLTGGVLTTNNPSGLSQATLGGLLSAATGAGISVTVGATTYTGTGGNLSFTASVSEGQLESEFASTSGGTITLNRGLATASITFTGTTLGVSNNTVIDNSGALTNDASDGLVANSTGATYSTTYTVDQNTGSVTVQSTTIDNTNSKYYAATGAAVYVDSSGRLTTASTSTGAATQDPLTALDTALATVDSMRSGLGAVQNRLESTITVLDNTNTNLADARSRIQDADYATEVSAMTKNQILQQAGTAVLAQANSQSQNVLSLLR
ncbi:MAG TPA: flagellin [Bordetella sp.]